jgi:hypothetical protein
MKKLILIIMILSVSVLFVLSCTEKKPVDRREQVSQMVEKGQYREAKQILITLRGQYPNDQQLIDLARTTDEAIAKEFYEAYWQEAEEAGGFQDWIAAMIKMKKVENTNREMVDEWIKKATEKCIDAGAKQLDDGKLLGLLNQLVQRYQVISHNDRLMLITMFVKEGRFPLKEWKDTFLTKYQELMDMDKEEFVGFPRPAQPEKK